MSDPVDEWAEAARRLRWEQPFEAPSIGEGADRRWFPGGTLNGAVNCVDRHLPDRAGQVAMYWEGEPGDRRVLTYGELWTEVVALARALTSLGIAPGDRVAIYAGWIPETVITMLACARIGALHCLVPTALPPEALADRLARIRARLLVTQDAAWRHGTLLPLKARADEALAAVGSVDFTVVIRRAGLDVAWYEGDTWYDEFQDGRPPQAGATAAFPADHPLLIVHLADWHGRATGVIHGTGGFLTGVSTLHRAGFMAEPDDVFFCAMELAWTGQCQGVYGPLAAGATAVMYEGMLDTPRRSRLWEVIERYGVNTLVTVPSVVRNLRRWEATPSDRALESLRLIATGGQRLDPASDDWLRKVAARAGATVTDAWGQLELGGLVTLTPPPGGPGSLPDPGLDVVGPDGAPLVDGSPGDLVIRRPWPATFVALEGSGSPDEYWEARPGVYATKDLARRRPDGTVELLGRRDPVVSISGQLVSLNEVADVLREHPFVQQAEVVKADLEDGPAIVACVVLDRDAQEAPDLRAELVGHVKDTIGGLGRPDSIVFVESFPPELPVEQRRSALERLLADPRIAAAEAISALELLAAAESETS